MELHALLGLVVANLLPLLARCAFRPTSNDASETFFIYFRQGTQKIPVTVKMDVPDKFAYVSSMNESGEEEESISLYDYRTHIIAFKDVQRNICYLEDMKDTSLLYERRLLHSLRNQVLLGNRETLYAQDPSLTRRQIQSIAGKRVARFCASAVTYKVSSQSTTEMQAGRSKRSISSDVPSTDRSGFQRSYSHHEQHTQSYANFGHETLSYDGNGDALTAKPPQEIDPQQTEDPIQPPSPSHLSTAKSRSGTRSIRELPSHWPPGSHAPSYVGAGANSGQVHSQIRAGGLGNHGFTANGQFQTAGSHASGYGRNGQHGGFGSAGSSTGSAVEESLGYQKPPKSSFTYGQPGGQLGSGANGHDQRSVPLGQSSFQPSTLNGQYGGMSGHPAGGQSGNYPNGRGIVTPNGAGYPHHASDTNQRFNGQGVQPVGGSGYPQGLTSSGNGYPAHQPSGVSVPINGAYTSGASGRNGGGGVVPSGYPGFDPRTQGTGLSSQSQIELEKGKVQTDSSTQGAYGGLSTQSQVQGSASKDGMFQAQAQSGFPHGKSQSQVQGSESRAQAGSSTSLTNFGQSQTQLQMGYDTRSSQASAQTTSGRGMISSQSQGGRQGGQASSQAQGSGGTTSAANVGFDNGGGNFQPSGRTSADSQFTGRASASSRGGFDDGQSQTQVKGDLHTGTTYSAAAHGSYGLPESSGGPVATSFPGSNGNLLNGGTGGTFGGHPSMTAPGTTQTDGSFRRGMGNGGSAGSTLGQFPTTNHHQQRGVPLGSYKPPGNSVYPSQTYPGAPSAATQPAQPGGYPAYGQPASGGPATNGGHVPVGSSFPLTHHQAPSGGAAVHGGPASFGPSFPLTHHQSPVMGQQPSAHHTPAGQGLPGKSIYGEQPGDRSPSLYPAANQRTPWSHQPSDVGNGQGQQQPIQSSSRFPSVPLTDPHQSVPDQKTGYSSTFPRMPQGAIDTGSSYPMYPSKPFSQGNGRIPVGVPASQTTFSNGGMTNGPTGTLNGFSNGGMTNGATSSQNGHIGALGTHGAQNGFGNGGMTNGATSTHSGFGSGGMTNGATGIHSAHTGRNGVNVPLYSGQGHGIGDGLRSTPLFSRSHPGTGDRGTIESNVMAGQNGQLLSTAVVGGVEAGQAQSQGILHSSGFRTHVISRPGAPIEHPVQPSSSQVGPWLAGQAQAQGFRYGALTSPGTRSVGIDGNGNRNDNGRVTNGNSQHPSHDLSSGRGQTSSGTRGSNGYQQPFPTSTHPRTYPVKTAQRWPQGSTHISQRQPHYASPNGNLRKTLHHKNRFSSSRTLTKSQCNYSSCSNGYRLVKSVKICKLVQPCQKVN